MTLCIAICDDDYVHVELVQNYIESMSIPYDIRYVLSYSGEELLESLDGIQIDIAFLDIEMKELNGIETGKRLRERNKDIIIVYLTGYKYYALEAFELESLNYLIKPITKEKFKTVLESALIRFNERRVFREKSKIFSIKTKDKLITLDYESIYYFEKNFRKLNIYTIDETIECYYSMSDLLKEIDTSYFIRCHQSYIVNKSSIKKICGNSLILSKKENDYIPISRKYKKELVEKFSKDLFNTL